MTDNAEKSFLAAQAAAMQDYGANGGVGEGGADNSDSDDYDPSATLHEDYSVPFDVSQEKSTATVPSAPASVDPSVSHALPSTMNNRPSSAANTQGPGTMKHFSSSSTLTQNQPRTKGGFVVDDDDEEEEEEDDEEDARDILDVYDTLDESKANAKASTSGPQSLLNSSSTAPVPPHDAVQSPVLANTVSNSASGVVPPSVAVPSSDVGVQSRNTVTPLQVAPTSQTNIVPISDNVNAAPTSAAPKVRLAHDTIGILEDRIKEDPRGDMAAWLELIDELKRRNKKEEVRRTYDNFFNVFPLAVSYVAQPPPSLSIVSS
jgi:cleavage stimulation factor subunit 3